MKYLAIAAALLLPGGLLVLAYLWAASRLPVDEPRGVLGRWLRKRP